MALGATNCIQLYLVVILTIVRITTRFTGISEMVPMHKSFRMACGKNLSRLGLR